MRISDWSSDVCSSDLLLVELVRERGLALLLITHDMGVVAQTCDRVAVMYAGRVVERNGVDHIFGDPQHPYTRALIGCIPRPGKFGKAPCRERGCQDV